MQPAPVPRFAVVIPAHDEEAVIGRCLSAWIGDLEPGEAEVVVAANGCSDATVEVARSFGITVLDLPVASKSAALTAGDAAVSAFPRIYLDADITVSADGLRAVATALEGAEPRVAAPAVRFVDEGRPWAVRAFYRTYRRLPYVSQGLAGLGIYGLSRAGRARFGDFPALTADDLFVQRLFASDERTTVAATFDVEVPRDLRSLVRVRQRTATGNRQLAADASGAAADLDPRTSTAATWQALLRLVRQEPRRLVDALVYAGVVLAGRSSGRGRADGQWQRDESTRTPVRGRRVGYLVSMYPALSHAFIEREVAALRGTGVEVVPFSVRACPPGQLLSDEARAEARRTLVLLGSPPRAWLRAHAGLVLRSPRAWLGGVLGALRTGRATPRDRLWQVFYFGEAVLLLHLARERGVQHLHVHFANNGADIARRAVAVGRAADGPDAWSWSLAVHGPTEFEDPEHFDLAAKVEDAAFVACISEYCRAQLRSLLPVGSRAQLEIVRMGVDPARFPPLAHERRSRAPGPLRVLFVGRLVPEKAPGVLLEAACLLDRDGTHPVEVAVIGGGPLAADLQDQVRRAGLGERVRLLGPVGQDDLPEWYAWADAFCLPSSAEGVPVVLMEAMASELPVLTTRITGIPELVQDGVTGLLVSPGDPAAVAASLARLDADPELRARLGRAARQRVLTSYTAATNARSLSSLLVPVDSASAGTMR